MTKIFTVMPFCDNAYHFMKSVRIWSFSGPYSVQMRKNTDQKNSEYRQFSRSVCIGEFSIFLITQS